MRAIDRISQPFDVAGVIVQLRPLDGLPRLWPCGRLAHRFARRLRHRLLQAGVHEGIAGASLEARPIPAQADRLGPAAMELAEGVENIARATCL